jgi:4-amino-4-deoxy-L-arabinose transferase-like glycosyltransferase
MRALLDPERDPGLPDGAPGRLELRLAAALTWVAALLVACAALWEIRGPVLAGHYASNASMGIIADNMVRWRIVGPVWQYTEAAPAPDLYYCHHPWGVFWTTTAVRAVLGRSDLVCRLPAALLSIATPFLISALGRALYRPIAGGAAALAFASTPIVLAFASFNALEVPVIAWGTMFLLGWARHAKQGRRRDLALALVGAALALASDWPAYVLVGSVLALEVVRRRRARLPIFRSGFVVGLAVIGVLSAAIVLGAFVGAGKLDELFASYALRAAPVRGDAAHRAYWDALVFTPIGLGLCRVGPLVFVVRALLRRQALELAPLAVVLMAATQTLAFPQGSAIHVFWPHHFALVLALVVAALTSTLASVLGHALALRGRGLALTTLLVCALCAPLARDAWPVLGWAHRSGGRFDERGLFISSEAEAIAVLRWSARELPEQGRVGLHRSLHGGWAHTFALGGRVVDADAGLAARADLGGFDALVVDARALRPLDARHLLEAADVRAIGPYFVARPGAPGLSGFRLEAREPTAVEWALDSGTEPVRTIEADPWHAWEVADHYGLGAAVPELPAPETTDSLRVAHNAAIARGEVDAAARLRTALLATFEPRDLELGDGVSLVGLRVKSGVKPRLELVFLASGPLRHGRAPSVVGHVVEGPLASTTPRDVVDRALAPAPFPPPTTWQQGYLYGLEVPLIPRPGVEALSLGLRGSGRPAVEIFRR